MSQTLLSNANYIKFAMIFLAFLNKLINADEHEYKLVNDLLKSYSLYARPSLDHKKATDVTFGLSLSQIIDVDEKNQIITTNCWITMVQNLSKYWIDNKLSWNESDYGGLKEIRLPHDKIWKPDVILYNNADPLASLSQVQTQMIIQSNGNVTWLSTNIHKSSCSINVQNYPFDTQNCSLGFASWTYDGDSINLLKLSDTGDITNYIANGEWTLENLLVERNIKIYSCCPVPYPDVTYYVVIRRRPLFYVFNMILPSILISIVGFLVFLIPPDSGEKVGMGVTTLLSMTVFLMVVAENMPPNSDSVPLIATYYLGSMFVISLATATSVLTMNTYKMGFQERPVPQFLQFIFFDIVARVFFISIKFNRDLKLSVQEAFPGQEYLAEYLRILKNANSNSSVTTKPSTSTKTNTRLFCCCCQNTSNQDTSKENENNFRYFYQTRYNAYNSNQNILPYNNIYSYQDPQSKRFYFQASSPLFCNYRLANNTSSLNSSLLNSKQNYNEINIMPKSSYQCQCSIKNKSNKLDNNTNNETNNSFETVIPINTILRSQTTNSINKKQQQKTSNYNINKTRNNNNNSFEVNCPNSCNTSRSRKSSIGEANALNNTINNRKLIKLLKNLNASMEKNDLKELKNEYKEDIKKQWKQLAEIIDMLLGLTFLLASIFMLLYLYKTITNY